MSVTPNDLGPTFGRVEWGDWEENEDGHTAIGLLDVDGEVASVAVTASEYIGPLAISTGWHLSDDPITHELDAWLRVEANEKASEL